MPYMHSKPNRSMVITAFMMVIAALSLSSAALAIEGFGLVRKNGGVVFRYHNQKTKRISNTYYNPYLHRRISPQ